MISFVCIFFPAVIAVNILSKLQERKFTIKEFVINYILFELLIVFTIEFILTFMFDNKNEILNSTAFSNYFVIKYLGISMILVCILPIIYEITRKNVSVKLNFERIGSNINGSKKKKTFKNKN